jgi:peptide deformylase
MRFIPSVERSWRTPIILNDEARPMDTSSAALVTPEPSPPPPVPAAEPGPVGKAREILIYPDQRLREKSVPLNEQDFAVGLHQTVVRDLIATAKATKAAGFSATQIGVPKRVIVVEVNATGSGEYKALINPVIKEATGKEIFNEGCMSFPGVFANIERPNEVLVEATSLEGTPCAIVFTGVEAEAVQHEIEHLDGVLLIDNVNVVRRGSIQTHMKQVNRRLKRIQTAQGKKAKSKTEILFGFKPEVDEQEK